MPNVKGRGVFFQTPRARFVCQDLRKARTLVLVSLSASHYGDSPLSMHLEQRAVQLACSRTHTTSKREEPSQIPTIQGVTHCQ